MAFENLSDKLQEVFKGFRSKGTLTEKDLKDGWVQGAACSTTGCYREVLLTGEQALLFVCTGYRVLESCWVCGVSCD